MRALILTLILLLNTAPSFATETEKIEVVERSMDASEAVTFQVNRSKVNRMLDKLLEDSDRAPAQNIIQNNSEPAQ